MKHSKINLAFFLLTALVSGCGKTPDNNAPAVEPSSPAVQPSSPVTPPVVMTALPASPSPQPSNNAPNASAEPPPANQQMGQATESLADYTFTQKSEFIQNMQTAREVLNQQLQHFSEKVDQASDEVKVTERTKLGTLQSQMKHLDEELTQAETSTEANWNATKIKVQEAYENARQALQDENQHLAQLASS